MTDLLLAIVVVGAVIAFGALISVGNERQRRAIEAFHTAYKQWAVQDIRIKRGTVSAQIRIEEPAAWLAKMTSLAFGQKISFDDYQLHNTPITTIESRDKGAGITVVYTLESPEALRKILKKKHAVFPGELHSNPLFRTNKKTLTMELSILNAGKMFDIELPVAWHMLTGQTIVSDTLWLYILD